MSKKNPAAIPAARMAETRAATLELAVEIDAPAAEVWRALTEETDAWWIDDLRCVSGDSRVTLEPRAGGQMLEQAADGGSLLWFTVVAVEPGVSLNLAGHLAPPFGGPATTYLLLRLEQRGDQVRLHMTNSMHGALDDGMLRATHDGWRLLFEDGLKRHVEHQRQP